MSNWKLLKGDQDWQSYQQHFKDQCPCCYFEGSPVKYPCLIQTVSVAPLGMHLKNIHKQIIVYVDVASFLMDYIAGRIE